MDYEYLYIYRKFECIKITGFAWNTQVYKIFKTEHILQYIDIETNDQSPISLTVIIKIWICMNNRSLLY